MKTFVCDSAFRDKIILHNNWHKIMPIMSKMACSIEHTDILVESECYDYL